MTKSKIQKQPEDFSERQNIATNDNIANFLLFKKIDLQREIESSQRMLKKLIENL